jgi:tetratricopeptide (TPR) repeat protein
VDEKLGDAHYNLGMVFEREGDVPGAEASYRAAILFSDDPLNAHARLGALLAREGDVEGALEELRTIRDIDPNSEAFRHLSAILTDT